MRVRALVLVSLAAFAAGACRGSADEERRAEENLRFAVQDLQKRSADYRAALTMRNEAESGLDYVVRQSLLQQGDEMDRAWWKKRENEKRRELSKASILLGQTRLDYMLAGQRYLYAERVRRRVMGRYRDKKLVKDWEERLKQYSEKNTLGPMPDDESRGGFPMFWAGILLGALCLALMAALTVRSILRSRRLQIDIRVRQPDELPIDSLLLADRYRLEQVVGRGGTGKVWRGRDTQEDRPVAVKEMDVLTGDKAQVLRKLFRKEAVTLADLRHPAIVELYEVVERGEQLFLVCEFVQGQPLHRLIMERKRILWSMARSIFIPVAEGLAFAHGRGFVHRDLKPPNIMVTDAGGVKVMDFGTAKPMMRDDQDEPETPEKAEDTERPDKLLWMRTSMIMGTPPYMCPENREGVVSPATDVFAFGATLYECLTGSLPFGYGGWTPKTAAGYRPPSVLAEELPGGLDGLIDECLEPEREKRLRSAEVLLERLREL